MDRIRAMPKGREMIIALSALIHARGLPGVAAEMLQVTRQDVPGAVAYLAGLSDPHGDPYAETKSTVAPGATTDANWAGNAAYSNYAAAEFVDVLRAGSCIGRLRGVHRCPFNTSFASRTSGVTVSFVGQNASTPIRRESYALNSLGYSKLVGIAVVSRELAKLGRPDVIPLLEASFLQALIDAADIAFLSNLPAVVDVSPAGIASGITPTASSGATAAAFISDCKKLLQAAAVANEVDSLQWVIPRTILAQLLCMTSTTGEPVHELLTIDGGMLLGVPVVATNAAHYSVSGGGTLYLINGSAIDYAESPSVDISVSTETSLEMTDAPNGPAQMVNLWQANLAGVRCERGINYARRRDAGIQILDGVVL